MILQNSINRDNLRKLMHSFYVKAINDEDLGVYFIDELGEDIDSFEWEDHIETLVDFWLAMILGEKTYGGNSSGRHYGVPNLTRKIFMKWMELFSETADEVYVSDVSALFKKKGMLLSEEFMSDLKI